tara:strand:- start:384 stop:881 length:498 start_codon:yes stop_codon:yes gene_type:complete
MIQTRIIGIDPGLRYTGWGVIDIEGSYVSFVACDRITTNTKDPLPTRLTTLHQELTKIINLYTPTSSAIEETFVNKNPLSSLKLGHARGCLIAAAALTGLEISEYSANKIKKSVVGVGHADKSQVAMMVHQLLPKATIRSEDASDALAVALCHGHYMGQHVAIPY